MRRHFLVSSIVDCFFAFFHLSQIHITITISVFSPYPLLAFHCPTTTKPIQRPARHNQKLAATNRSFGLYAFHNRQRISDPTFLPRGVWWIHCSYPSGTLIFHHRACGLRAGPIRKHQSKWPWHSASVSRKPCERPPQIHHSTNHPQQIQAKAENDGHQMYTSLVKPCLEQSTVPPSRKNTKRSWSRSAGRRRGGGRVS